MVKNINTTKTPNNIKIVQIWLRSGVINIRYHLFIGGHLASSGQNSSWTMSCQSQYLVSESVWLLKGCYLPWFVISLLMLTAATFKRLAISPISWIWSSYSLSIYFWVWIIFPLKKLYALFRIFFSKLTTVFWLLITNLKKIIEHTTIK